MQDSSGLYKLLGAVPQLGGAQTEYADGVAHQVPTRAGAVVDTFGRSLQHESNGQSGYQDYRVIGTWTNGRFTPADRAGDAHFTSKGLAPDREGRMMAHYFDHDRWQEEMNARKATKKSKKRALNG